MQRFLEELRAFWFGTVAFHDADLKFKMSFSLQKKNNDVNTI